MQLWPTTQNACLLVHWLTTTLRKALQALRKALSSSSPSLCLFAGGIKKTCSPVSNQSKMHPRLNMSWALLFTLSNNSGRSGSSCVRSTSGAAYSQLDWMLLSNPAEKRACASNRRVCIFLKYNHGMSFACTCPLTNSRHEQMTMQLCVCMGALLCCGAAEQHTTHA